MVENARKTARRRAGIGAEYRWKLTCDDLVDLPEDRLRHELIDGEHYVTPSPNLRHQTVALNIAFIIRTFLKTRPLGRVFVAPLDVLFSNIDAVEPDVLFVSRARQSEVLRKRHLVGAPDLVVESARSGRAVVTKR